MGFLHIPPHSLRVMLLVLGLLCVASLARLVFVHKNVELRQRIRSWWVMVGILFACLVAGRIPAIILFALVSFLALREFLTIVPVRESDRRVLLWGYIAIPLQYYFIAIGWYGMFTILIPIYLFLFLPMHMVLTGETRGFIRAVGVMHWAVMLTVYCLSHVAALLTLPEANQDAGRIGPVLFLLLMTQLNDVSQYLWGKSLGRRKIVPRVSPNKTWAGFLGGLGTITLAAGLVGPWLTPLTPAWSLLAGLLIAVSGFIGDVVLSSVKRDLEIKDSGTLIPGHGGILDRIDSLLFTAPLFFHYLHYIAF